MSTLAEIEVAAARLAPEEKRSLLNWLTAELSLENSSPTDGLRVSGLGNGQWLVADDFDAALPEAFWLGRDA